MGRIVLILTVVSVLAGVGISIEPVGVCNHSLWQVACVFVLMPSILGASCFFDINSWGFQRMMFITGSVQAGIIIGLYYLAARAFKRPKKGTPPNDRPAK